MFLQCKILYATFYPKYILVSRIEAYTEYNFFYYDKEVKSYISGHFGTDSILVYDAFLVVNTLNCSSFLTKRLRDEF